MKKLMLIAAVLALAGCKHLEITRPGGDLSRAEVFVVDGYIVVNQEPVIVRRSQKQTTATWQLAGTNATNLHVTIDAWIKPIKRTPSRQAQRPDWKPVTVDCRPVERGSTSVTCDVSKLEPGFYAYTIRVDQDGRTIELDPTVMIDN
jgi:hypothetical protein